MLDAGLVARHRAVVLYPPSHLAELVGARSGDIGRLSSASRTSKSATCKSQKACHETSTAHLTFTKSIQLPETTCSNAHMLLRIHTTDPRHINSPLSAQATNAHVVGGKILAYDAKSGAQICLMMLKAKSTWPISCAAKLLEVWNPSISPTIPAWRESTTLIGL